MNGPLVVLDTDFLSAFLKIDQLSLVKDFYRVELLLVPPSVYREMSQTSLLQRLAAIPWLQIEATESSRLEELAQQVAFQDLGAGEKEAIALTLQLSSAVLLMNDNRARRVAIQCGVQVMDIPAFLLACKLSGLLDRNQMAETVRALQEKDHYGFRADVLARLLG